MSGVLGGRRPARFALALVLCATLRAEACWNEAAARYQVDSSLLYAIAQTESGMNPLAVGRNRNGSRDIGLMQINSAWLPTLAAYGISERDLFQPCTSIHVGAWLLAHNFQRLGYNWDAVGAYNAVSPELRLAYARKVHRNLTRVYTNHPKNPSAPTKARSNRSAVQRTGD